MCVSGAFRAVVLLAASELLWWNPRVVVICAAACLLWIHLQKSAMFSQKSPIFPQRTDTRTTPMKSSCGNMRVSKHLYVCYDLFVCVSCDIFICDMTYWYVWHDPLISVTWLIDMCDMTHWYVWHFSCICLKPELLWWNPRVAVMCVTCHTRMCDMTHSYVCRDPFMCVTWPIHMCEMTNSYVWHDSLICVKLKLLRWNCRGGGNMM